MPHYDILGSHLEKVHVPGLVNAFIISNTHLESILLNRNLVGLAFTKRCESSTESFLQHFRPELTDCIQSGIAELMLLSKGVYYWMHNAFGTVFDRNLEINFAATSRDKVSEQNAEINLTYVNFDAPAKTLILGDTIATGATVCKALSSYREHWPLERVFLFAMAGSILGGQTISSFCESQGIELTLAYGLAAFGLGSNGFDLSFLHPDTITSERYRERARQLYKGQPVSAAGWDFGTQAQALKKYRMLSWIEAERWGLLENEAMSEIEPPNDSDLVMKERSAYTS